MNLSSRNNYSEFGPLMDRFQVGAFRVIFASQTISEKNMQMAFTKAVVLSSDESINAVVRDEKRISIFGNYLEMLLGNSISQLYYSGKTTPKVARNCRASIKDIKKLIKHLKTEVLKKAGEL